VDYLRHGDARLATLLEQVDVLAHSFVIGELALGHLRHREELMDALEKLPRLAVASDDDVMRLIGRHGLHGIGIGYVDAHLLAALRAVPGCRLWTKDRRLHAAGIRLGVAA
jgi:predicted nucleic acid-binding protein